MDSRLGDRSYLGDIWYEFFGTFLVSLLDEDIMAIQSSVWAIVRCKNVASIQVHDIK